MESTRYFYYNRSSLSSPLTLRKDSSAGKSIISYDSATKKLLIKEHQVQSYTWRSDTTKCMPMLARSDIYTGNQITQVIMDTSFDTLTKSIREPKHVTTINSVREPNQLRITLFCYLCGRRRRRIFGLSLQNRRLPGWGRGTCHGYRLLLSGELMGRAGGGRRAGNGNRSPTHYSPHNT
jgi:hypothetical protein